jgi:hypothetical protein
VSIPSENVLDLRTLIKSGFKNGIWTSLTPGATLSGSSFTAAKNMEGRVFRFNYRIPGVDGPGTGNCNDRNYVVEVAVASCFGRIGDQVWEDANLNGIQDGGEPLMRNVTVRLLNFSGEVIGTTITDNIGIYYFDNLPASIYMVEFVKPSGYIPTKANSGPDEEDSDADEKTGRTGQIVLKVGDENLTVDAGFYRLAELGDFVWLDVDKDGLQDNDESGVANVQVNLLSTSGTQLSTTKTDNRGYYLFQNLLPGMYQVEFVLPTGYKRSPMDAVASDFRDSDANVSTGRTKLYTLLSGQSELSVDAGIFIADKSKLGDYVWEDEDGDGQQDPNEVGVSDVTVKLLNSNGQQISTTTTNAQGITRSKSCLQERIV